MECRCWAIGSRLLNQPIKSHAGRETGEYCAMEREKKKTQIIITEGQKDNAGVQKRA